MAQRIVEGGGRIQLMTAQPDFALYESISRDEDPLSEEETGVVATQANRPSKRPRKALAPRATIKET
jgi:hypothetical protein